MKLTEKEKLVTELLDECSQKIFKEVVKFVKVKIANDPSLLDRFAQALPLVCYHGMNKMISEWLQDENQIEHYKNRMENDLKRYIEEFRGNF